ncbi:hypothetical protein [Leekyejoonella antrihumi]|uniref:Uncharacterized protein n=1 Tax=Leekyejoonella antrihumi TaxID=1660198 RepID=A0A563E660_9MICO|nr:hypothetical protein [Leekyejoonella antrihumi]TWP37324.1 hypothetical protein FGL98_06105 [Leekyejoonella antrihumi]
MFWAIVLAVLVVVLAFCAAIDRRRRRRGMKTAIEDGSGLNGPGAHGAYAAGLREGIRGQSNGFGNH